MNLSSLIAKLLKYTPMQVADAELPTPCSKTTSFYVLKKRGKQNCFTSFVLSRKNAYILILDEAVGRGEQKTKNRTKKSKNRTEEPVNRTGFLRIFGSVNRTKNFFRFTVRFRFIGLKKSG